MSDDKDGEARTFREAMRGVRRLRRAATSQASPPKPAPEARFTRADRVEVLRESLLAPADEGTLGIGEELSFRRAHVPESVLVRLRRGQYAVDDELDLHGMTAAQAKAVLREFIAEAVQRHLTCVRVIHGKGRRSGPRGPVLKKIVNHWLQRTDAVLAFGSARTVDGGSGAVYVLLRRRSG